MKKYIIGILFCFCFVVGIGMAGADDGTIWSRLAGVFIFALIAPLAQWAKELGL